MRAKIADSREELIRVLANLVVWLPKEEQSELRRAFKEWFRQKLLPRHLPGEIIEDVRDLTPANSLSVFSMRAQRSFHKTES